MRVFRVAALTAALCAAAAGSDPEYDNKVNWALKQNTDAWGEDLIQKGGATFENIKDYLKPLFYSTGTTREALDVHSLLLGLDGGEPPWVIPVADGSRIFGDNFRSIHFLQVSVGPNGNEPYGSALERLSGPFLDQGYYPVLKTEYRDREGNSYAQESLAASIPELPDLVAMIKITAKPSGAAVAPKIRLALAEYDLERESNRLVSGRKTFIIFTGSPHIGWDHHNTELTWEGGQTVYAMWLPRPTPLGDFTLDGTRYERAKAEWLAYWDKRLTKGAQIHIPEPVAANALKNTIIQNLIMRQRYSLGAAVYHTDWYPREGCDSLNALGLLGYLDEYREGLAYMLGKPWREREFGRMATWGEYMAHAARYYFLSHDTEFIRRNTSLYEQYARAMQQQIDGDPNGLVGKTNRTADIGALGYWTNEQAVCWRGLRDMAEVWRLTGRTDLYERFAPVAARFQKGLLKAVEASKRRMSDGSLFVPIELLADHKPYESITETRDGSYWNLTFPYAMGSGLWPANSPDMDGMVAYMRKHGGLLLGLLRFNLHPTPIGGFHKGSISGYFTSGFDNVYLTGYLQAIADRDDAEHLILGFYGKLAHGMTRNTFSEGEGSSVGPIPPEVETVLDRRERRLIEQATQDPSARALGYRATCGAPNSTNNAVYLEALRLMLVREGFNDVTGSPENLYLAHATPRPWLESGKEIEVADVPTWFGPVGYRLRSSLADKRVSATVNMPASAVAKTIGLKLRTPGRLVAQSVTINGQPWTKFDAATETIDLTGTTGTVNIEVRYH